MARGEVERYQNFMLEIVVVDATGGNLVAEVAVEEVAMVEENGVGVEVVVTGRGGVDISARSYTNQEWDLLSYDEKSKIFSLCNKA